MAEIFHRWKCECLNKQDRSLKGSVDQDITHIVSLINSCDQFFTTSSCSGRVLLIETPAGNGEVRKQKCVWLFVSHQPCSCEDVMEALLRSSEDSVMKFEPFVLHVQCRKLEDAQLLHSVAVQSGFRNSGITVGKSGKIMMAVRSTHGLEVPLTQKGKLLIGRDYVDFLTQTANQKMEENLRRIQRFYQNLQAALEARQEPKESTGVYRRRRRRKREAVCHHGDEENDLQDGLDPGGILLPQQLETD